jgi:uncharacterized membrane protein YphA (DoxX/SURF4 family)
MYPTQRTEDITVMTLRAVLGAIFVWIGLLQVAGLSPTFASVGGSVPYFGVTQGITILGVLSVLIGVLLFINSFWWLAELLLVLYLVGVGLVFVVEPTAAFQPEAPILTTFGELMLKNIVLGIAGVVVLLHETRRRRKSADQ